MKKKKLMLFGVLGLFAIALVSAGLLSYFGLFSFTATISPAITVDGQVAGTFTHDIPEEAPGGEVFCFLHKVENKASIPIDLELEIIGGHSGVDIEMYNVPETTTLILCEKDSNWDCITGASATLEFDTVNPSFDYTLSVLGLQASTEYALIYYADDDPRFSAWGGDNPGKIIDTFNTDGSGNYNGANDVDLNMNLPSLPDWNINPSPNYCNGVNGFDYYEHCRGAKVWIVPISDLTSGQLPLVNWNPTAWLFETDLITYSDCDLYTDYVVDFTEDRGESISVLGTQSHSMTPMLICYDFDEMAHGTFNVDTMLKLVE